MIQAKIIADSKNEFGNRITTMVVTFPRFILAELNTHRMMSRNSASSRAIPFEKMLKSVEENPFIPIAWQKEHKGMQGTEYFTDPTKIENCKIEWLTARDRAVTAAKDLSLEGITKQLCNRLLEPFMWHTVIITATEWENFFALRCPQYKPNPEGSPDQIYRSKKDMRDDCQSYFAEDSHISWLKANKGQAEIHMMALAEAMWDAMNESTPKELRAGEWHAPFVDNIDDGLLDELCADNGWLTSAEVQNELAIKIATARCARISYTVVGEEEKEPNYENDIILHDRLRKAGHMSPFEHCAQAMYHIKQSKQNSPESWSGNFQGFTQYRKTLPNENITK